MKGELFRTFHNTNALEKDIKMTIEEMRKLTELHMNAVFQFCCYLTGSRQEAEDLCQETFVTFVEKRQDISLADKRETKNYLLGIATNHWRNHRRKIGRRQKVDHALSEEEWNNLSSGEDMEADMLKDELQKNVQRAIRMLPDKQRVVINLVYAGELRIDEVASLLRLPRETVKSRLRLAKKKLRKILEEQGYEV